MQLNNGTELQGGKYRIIRVLGQGGFGITYLAENSLLDKKVAIKEFFPKDFCGRDNTSHLILGTQNNTETVEKLKARFLKEARNIAKLDHPGIVRIHDVFQDNNTAYYVMDYIEGESLSEMVKRGGPLPEAQAVEYIQKIGEALEYIHSRHMTHFDVKPANIMVRHSDNTPVLIDFGLSKQYDAKGDATSTLMQGVSHGFSPIELYNAGAITSFSPQTDIYSLGATLYYLLTGTVPPDASQLLEEGLNIPASIRSTVADAICAAMTVSRTKRPASLAAWLPTLTTKTTPTSASEATQSFPFAPDDTTSIIDTTKTNSKISDQLKAAPTPSVKAQIELKSHYGTKLLSWSLFLLVAVIIIFIILYARSNVSDSQSLPPKAFTDKSKLKVGDYIYGDCRYFSHEKLTGETPTAIVISDNSVKEVITLQPIAHCNYNEIDAYVNQYKNKHFGARVPSVKEWRMILKNIYHLTEVDMGIEYQHDSMYSIGPSHDMNIYNYYAPGFDRPKHYSYVVSSEFDYHSTAWASDYSYKYENRATSPKYGQNVKHQRSFSLYGNNSYSCVTDESKELPVFVIYQL